MNKNIIMKLLPIIVVIPLLLIPIRVIAQTTADFYVATDGDDSDGLSWGTAFTTLQQAIDSAVNGNEIWVKTGIYTIDSTVQVNKAVFIYGGFSGTDEQRDISLYQSIIDGNNSIRCMIISDDATINGLNIINGYSSENGGGIYCSLASPALINCTITNCTGLHGGGMYAENSNLITINNCMFFSNNAYGGGGIYLFETAVLIKNSILSNNQADIDGGAIHGRLGASGNLTIINSLIVGNRAVFSQGGGFYIRDASLDILNCTFADNTSTNNSDALYSTATTTITNSIVWNRCLFFTTLTVKYSCTIGGYAGEGNINLDPLFEDPGNANFHLQSDSPCIDVGPSVGSPDHDIEGTPRPQGDGYDMGAYEFISSSPFEEIIEAEDMFYHANGMQVGDYWLLWSNGTMSEDVEFPETCTYRFEIIARGSLVNSIGPEMELIIDGETKDRVIVNNTTPETLILEVEISEGTHEFAIGFYNDYYNPSAGLDRNLYVDKTTITMIDCSLQGDIWHVNNESTCTVACGTSWGNAFSNIQDAIDSAIAGEEIWVKEGTYYLSSQIEVNKVVSMYGGFDGTETEREQRDWENNITTVDGQESVRCFKITYNGIIDGLTITNGLGLIEPPLISSVGGGIYIIDSSPTIINCTLLRNAAFEGAGICSEGGSPKIIKSSISDSIPFCELGGGIFLNSGSVGNPTIIESCIIKNNDALYGAGIFASGFSNIENCTISGNYEQGIHMGPGNFNVSNCIINLNLGAQCDGAGIEVEGATATITNCTIYGNDADFGGGGINIRDELPFVNDVTIKNCIISGNTIEQIYGPANISYCDIDQDGYGNPDGSDDINGNIRQNPVFVDANNGDYRLQVSSPCIDSGTSNGAPETDIEGTQRSQGDGYDMGAYEFISSSPFEEVIEAEDMFYHANGMQIGDYWLLWSNGVMSEDVEFPETCTYRFEIIARGSLVNSIGPEMEHIIDGEPKGSVFVNTTTPETFVFDVELTKGVHEFAIGFYNDFYDPPEDRNLYVDKITITQSSECVNDADCDEGFFCVSNQCVECRNNEDCFDGLWCTVGDICSDGTCIDGVPRDCSAFTDQCNDGVCDEDSDSCIAQPVANGTPCNDNLFCTQTDQCTDGTCFGSGDPCPGQTCDETNDRCVVVCVEDFDCDDGNPSTNDICNNGICEYINNALIIEAEDMGYHANGMQVGDYWLLWSNGVMSESVEFPETGTYRFEIIARGSLVNSIGPEMEHIIDGEPKGSVFVNTTTPETFIFEVEISAGIHEFAIGFYNDYYNPSAGLDRNLYVDKTIITKSNNFVSTFLFAQQQLTNTINQINDFNLYPYYTRKDNGNWITVDAPHWVSGFFSGCLWYMYQYNGDEQWRIWAENTTAGLENQQYDTTSHDVGFQLMPSYGLGYRLTGNPIYKQILLQGAASLATRYNSAVGCIRSWSWGGWTFPVIVDNMMNLELLFWGAKNGGQPEWFDMAVNHSYMTLTNHVRPDGSTYHLVDYDDETGEVISKGTWAGYSDDSTWATGQAWAIYGFMIAYRESGEQEFLQTAMKVADYFIDHLPEDFVAPVDFDMPNPDAPKDSTASAIAASGLIELSTFVSLPEDKQRYQDTARNILNSLQSPAYLAVNSNSSGILLHATDILYSPEKTDVSLIFADYYFLEALLRAQQ